MTLPLGRKWSTGVEERWMMASQYQHLPSKYSPSTSCNACHVGLVLIFALRASASRPSSASTAALAIWGQLAGSRSSMSSRSTCRIFLHLHAFKYLFSKLLLLLDFFRRLGRGEDILTVSKHRHRFRESGVNGVAHCDGCIQPAHLLG